MNEELTKFILFLNNFGFELNLFRSWTTKENYDFPEETILSKYNDEIANHLSGCFENGLTLQYLINNTTEQDSINGEIKNLTESRFIEPRGNYLGTYISNESHNYILLCDNIRCFVINTYGGIPYMIIKEHNINDANLLIRKIKNKSKDAFIEFFGIYPIHEMEYDVKVHLYKLTNNLPNKNTILKRINNIRDYLEFDEEKRILDEFSRKVQNYLEKYNYN